MLPERIVEFVNGQYVLLVGTRDDRLVPDGTIALGAIADPADDSVTLFLPLAYSEPALSNLQTNGALSLSVGHGEGHEGYQLKGTFRDKRELSQQDEAIQDIYRTKVVAHVAQEAGQEVSQALWDAIIYRPAVAVRFEVEQIFDQTPGPNAGAQIEF